MPRQRGPGLPAGQRGPLQTVERPVVLDGRMSNPGRADEVVASPHFLYRAPPARRRHADRCTCPRPRRPPPASTRPPARSRSARGQGPHRRGRSAPRFSWTSRATAASCSRPTPSSSATAPIILGGNPERLPHVTSTRFIRLNGGEAEIPAFRADLARVSGRSDIDVWDNADTIGRTVGKADRVRGGVPARVRPGGAARRAVPCRPGRRQVRRGQCRRTPGAAGRRPDPVAGRGVGRRRALASPRRRARRSASPPRTSRRRGCRSASPRSPSRIPASARTGRSSAPAGPSPCCSSRPAPPRLTWTALTAGRAPCVLPWLRRGDRRLGSGIAGRRRGGHALRA